jgi:polyferredoxin
MWQKSQNEYFRGYGIPIYTDLIFDGIFGLSVIQSLFVIAIANLFVWFLGITSVDPAMLYVWGGISIVIYLYNEYYYRRRKHYKDVLKYFRRKKLSNIPMLISIVTSLASATLSGYLLWGRL